VGDFRCYQSACRVSGSETVIDITIGETVITCETDGQSLSPSGFSGSLTCPSSIDDFCYESKPCPYFCSKLGYCTNSECHCFDPLVENSEGDCVASCNSEEYYSFVS